MKAINMFFVAPLGFVTVSCPQYAWMTISVAYTLVAHVLGSRAILIQPIEQPRNFGYSPAAAVFSL